MNWVLLHLAMISIKLFNKYFVYNALSNVLLNLCFLNNKCTDY